MISEPSDRPMFIKPIVETRQLFQPSVNFFEPIRMLTVVSSSLMPRKIEPENSRSVTTSSPYSSQSLQSVAASPRRRVRYHRELRAGLELKFRPIRYQRAC